MQRANLRRTLAGAYLDFNCGLNGSPARLYLLEVFLLCLELLLDTESSCVAWLDEVALTRLEVDAVAWFWVVGEPCSGQVWDEGRIALLDWTTGVVCLDDACVLAEYWELDSWVGLSLFEFGQYCWFIV